MSKILQVCAIDLSVDVLLKPLVQALMGQGHVVHCACSNTGRFDSLMEQGLCMIDIPIERKISPLSNQKSLVALFKLMKTEKYDVVHVHTPVAAVLGRIAARLAGVKTIVYTAHGFYFHEEMPKWEYAFFYGLEKFLAVYFTDWIFLQSKEDCDLCIRDRFKNPGRVVHIGNGVDVDGKFNPIRLSPVASARLRNTLGISAEDVVFTFIGRLVREKGIFELLGAFQTLARKETKIKLLLIGDLLDSDRGTEAYMQIQEANNDPNIVITGFRRDIPELLAMTDVFILPSYREGLPRSIIEAMAMAIPIIATNIRGCREEVFDGKNGFLVNKEDSEDLCAKMEYLLHNADKRKEFGEHSRVLAERLFKEENVIRKQLSVLR
ncbi:putative glycosyltransferase EpsD [Peptococcaceae bacterium CEB3]|nr:putative glycosyltransferase EpsD [Peptococcaceae bacterium CEB3]